MTESTASPGRSFRNRRKTSAGCRYRCSCPTDSGAPLQPFAFLRLILLTADHVEIIRQASQQIERSNHGSVLLPQHDLIPSPKDLNFLALQSKLLRQPDCLTVSGPEYPRSTHAPTSTKRIYVQYTRGSLLCAKEISNNLRLLLQAL